MFSGWVTASEEGNCKNTVVRSVLIEEGSKEGWREWNQKDKERSYPSEK